MTRGTRWVVAGVALGSVLLAGCETSGDDDPSPTPTPSASSVSPSASPSRPTPTPSESGPEIPAAAREQTPAGAEAYVEYFFDQFNVAWTKPQPGLIKSLSDSQCQFCKKGETAAADLAAHGERYATDPVTIKQIDPFGGAPQGQQFLQIRHVQNKASVIDTSGAVVTQDPRVENDFYVTLVWRSDRWRLLELERTS